MNCARSPLGPPVPSVEQFVSRVDDDRAMRGMAFLLDAVPVDGDKERDRPWLSVGVEIVEGDRQLEQPAATDRRFARAALAPGGRLAHPVPECA